MNWQDLLKGTQRVVKDAFFYEATNESTKRS